MDKLVYLTYPVLLVLLFWGSKFYSRGNWNDDAFSLSQMKAIQGFSAICIMLHHIGQKTCASWVRWEFKLPGLELFVPIGYFFVGVFLFCSGYGLYKSYQNKPDYLNGFFRRRILPLITMFYVTGFIFLFFRVVLGEWMDTKKFLFYLSGWQLPNLYAWFVIAMPLFYAGFYFSFKYCKNKNMAMFLTCLVVFLYTLAGTFIDHNNYWMRGEWWYNSVHMFTVGMLFARFEKKIVAHLKKYHTIYIILAFVGIFVLYAFSEYTQARFSYYGEQFRADDKVLRRWICLISQMAASFAFAFFIFLMGMRVKLGNRVLAFMGGLTLEFYLIHGLFVELFGYNFDNACPSLYYIQNVALFIVVVVVCAIPSALLLQKLTRLVRDGKVKKLPKAE